MKDLIDLKNKIENLEKHHQQDILKIIIKYNITFSENRNGIFLNMNHISEDGLSHIRNYLDHIGNQEKILKDTEIIKKKYKDTFFTNNNNEYT